MKYLLLLSVCISMTVALPQRKAQIRQNYQEEPQQQQDNFNNYPQENQPTIQDFRPKPHLETTTYIPIIRFEKQAGDNGSYKTAYETGNHIFAEETGYLKNIGDNIDALVQQGAYSYTAPDGQVITVEYTADEHGFRVKGDHIPTPPPVSPEIQKGLDLIYAGIKANQERSALDIQNNPEAAKSIDEKAALDYKGIYHQN